MQTDSLMCQNVNLSWKIVGQNAGCVIISQSFKKTQNNNCHLSDTYAIIGALRANIPGKIFFCASDIFCADVIIPVTTSRSGWSLSCSLATGVGIESTVVVSGIEVLVALTS